MAPADRAFNFPVNQKLRMDQLGGWRLSLLQNPGTIVAAAPGAFALSPATSLPAAHNQEAAPFQLLCFVF